MQHPRVLLSVLILALSTACVTSADIEAIGERVQAFELVLNDGTKSQLEVEAAMVVMREGISEVQEDIEGRTENFLTGLSTAEQAGTGGLMALGTGFLLNMYRDGRRRKRGEKVSV